jgi:hypothetical protein
MIQIKITTMKPDTMLGIVKELRSKGYVQGVDFDFAYYQSKWDNMIGEIPRETIFTFYKDELATWFELLYK